MSMPIESQPVPLTRTPHGVILISGTRVHLETVVRAFQHGASPEEIAQDYPLTLASVYAVIAYYLWHRADVDTYLAERRTAYETAQAAYEAHANLTGIRARLLARIEEAA